MNLVPFRMFNKGKKKKKTRTHFVGNFNIQNQFNVNYSMHYYETTFFGGGHNATQKTSILIKIVSGVGSFLLQIIGTKSTIMEIIK